MMKCVQIALLVLALVGCDSRDSSDLAAPTSESALAELNVIEGELVFGGHGLFNLNLDDMSVTSELELDRWLINSLSAIHDDEWLISAYSLSPGPDRKKVFVFDRTDRSLEELTYGSMAQFMNFGDSVILSGRGGLLGSVSLADDEPVFRVLDDERNVLPSEVVPISESEFLFERRDALGTRIWIHNLETDLSTALPGFGSCSLQNAVWRGATEQLLCSKKSESVRGAVDYSLIDLSGNEELLDFELDSVWPVTYLQHLDMLILQQRVFDSSKSREIHPLWTVDLQSGRKSLLSEDLNLGTAVIYLE